MAGYSTEEEARADGFILSHEPEQDRFALKLDDRVVGTAHYTLRGDTVIDFDGTRVAPELRGRGLAGLLAHRALSDDVRVGRDVKTSCWFMEGYLERHPELQGL